MKSHDRKYKNPLQPAMNDHPQEALSHVDHIGFFNSNKVWGGGEKWHFSTALMMTERNINVTVFAQPDCELIKRTLKAGIQSFAIRVSNVSFLNLLKVFRLSYLFRKLRIQVIILNLPSDVKFAGIAARLAGVKKIIYRRGSPVPVKNSLMNRFLFRYVLTDIIANSGQIKQSILQNNPALVKVEKITVIYNGINGSLPVIPRMSDANAVRDNRIVIGAAGRLSPEKGIEYLLRMASLLKDKKREFKLIIAGDGPLKGTLIRKSNDLGLSENVYFKGFVPEMDLFYNNIDLFVLTSAWEGCSNVILEAMYQGLPVVAFNNSSIPELVINMKNGLLVKNEDTGDLAGKVEQLMSDPALRLRLGEAGKQTVREKYDMNRCFDQLMKLISH